MGPVELYFCALLAPYTQELLFMSQHKSLQGSSGIVIKRNVLKRFERVELLKKRGQWKTGDRVQGLRKTKPDV
jgi:small basic protein (TIGR04137 family)